MGRGVIQRKGSGMRQGAGARQRKGRQGADTLSRNMDECRGRGRRGRSNPRPRRCQPEKTGGDDVRPRFPSQHRQGSRHRRDGQQRRPSPDHNSRGNPDRCGTSRRPTKFRPGTKQDTGRGQVPTNIRTPRRRASAREGQRRAEPFGSDGRHRRLPPQG
jgi:hypothetical protein